MPNERAAPNESARARRSDEARTAGASETGRVVTGLNGMALLLRVELRQRQQIDRKRDMLVNHGVHVAETDLDRHLARARPQRRDDTTMPPAISTNASIW